MNIEINVRGRELVNDTTYRIPSGSTGDCFIAFHFEPGYGWEGLDITAVFSRQNYQTYKVNIQPDVYIAVPSTVISKPGNIFVGLVGVKGTETIIQSLTTTLTVEHNVFNMQDPAIYPVDESGNPDPNAYAQYVQLVTDALNRAELAAAKLEAAADGSYTKTESDARYAKRTFAKTTVQGEFDTSYSVAASDYAIQVNALPPQEQARNIITGIRVAVENSNNELSYGYKGFNLRRLNDTIYDTFYATAGGVYVTNKVYALTVGDAVGEWTDDTHYVVSLVLAEDIDLSQADSTTLVFSDTLTDIALEITSTSISICLPTKPTDEELKAIEIWYPRETPAKTLISATSIGVIPDEPAIIKVYKTVDGTETPVSSFTICAELDTTKFLNSYASELEELKSSAAVASTKIYDLEAKLIQAVTLAEVTIEDTQWDSADGVYNVNINEITCVPTGLYLEDETTLERSPIDFTYIPIDTGITLKTTFKNGELTPGKTVLTYIKKIS